MRKRSYKEKRPLGAMQVQRTRHSEPSYFRSLVAAGIIDGKASIDTAWSVWTTVCGDAEFIRLSRKLEESKKVFLPSVASPFQNGAQLLKSMNHKQLDALKERIGITREETK